MEWKKHDASWRGAKGIELWGRIDNLARLWNAEPKPVSLNVLKCAGYFDDVSNSRCGFVFLLPGPDTDQFVSLKEFLDSPSAENLPTLEQRYQLAYGIGLSVALLHPIGWLHKSIRSHNIMLHVTRGETLWSRPYLVGFEYARQNEPDQSSEKPEQSVRFNLYRHPLAAGDPNERFKNLYDLYSCGIVFLEIGCWRSARKWPRVSDNPQGFLDQTVMPRIRQKLAHWMGIHLQQAILRCVDGSLDVEQDVTVAFYIQIVETLSRLT